MTGHGFIFVFVNIHYTFESLSKQTLFVRSEVQLTNQVKYFVIFSLSYLIFNSLWVVHQCFILLVHYDLQLVYIFVIIFYGPS